MGRVGVKHLFASDFGRNVAKYRRDLVTEPGGISDKTHGSGTAAGGARTAILTLLASTQQQLNRVFHNVVLLLKVRPVHGKQGPRGVVQQTENVNLALGLLDAQGKRTLVVCDADQLDNRLFSQVDCRRDKR